MCVDDSVWYGDGVCSDGVCVVGADSVWCGDGACVVMLGVWWVLIVCGVVGADSVWCGDGACVVMVCVGVWCIYMYVVQSYNVHA